MGKLEKNVYLCTHRTMDAFHLWDWGVPDWKSCQVRSDSFSCPLRHFFNVDLLCK